MGELLRVVRIKDKAAKLIEVNSSFEQDIKDFMLDTSIPSMEKVELHEWLETQGLSDYL